jgi:toxin ParE1/3/4
MDYQIIWSPRSLENLEELISLIAVQNAAAASQFGKKILHRVSQLQSFPRLGARFAKLNRGDIRELAMPPWRVFYHLKDEQRVVTIITIWHGAQEEPDLSQP